MAATPTKAQLKIQKDLKWAKALLSGIEKKKASIANDEKASPHYWNGDTWGSISGIRDAAEWEENELARYVLKHARRKVESRRG